MSWTTWSLLQSGQVKEICSHMTHKERKELGRRGITYGLWVFATLALPIGEAVRHQSRVFLLVAAIMIVVNFVGALFWQRKLKSFLASTEWATSSGYRAEDLRLFGRG